MKVLNKHIEDFLNNWRHVVVFVLGETTTENDVLLISSEGAVLVSKGIVTFVIHQIKLLHAGFVLGGILFANDGFWAIINGLPEHLKMLVLDDAGIRHIVRGIVYNRVALIVRGIFYACLEGYRAPVKITLKTAAKVQQISDSCKKNLRFFTKKSSICNILHTIAAFYPKVLSNVAPNKPEPTMR